MISFQQIADRLATKKEEYGSYKSVKFEDNWEPEKCTDFVVPPFVPLTYSNAKGAQAKWRNRLTDIYTFVKIVQSKRYNEGCTIMPIPTTAKVNLDIWGTPTSIVNARKAMCEMGLISPHTTDKSFGKGRAGKSYTYKYYKENEDRFIQYCKDNNIEFRVLKNDNYDDVADMTDFYGLDKSKVRFATHLRLTRPKGVSPKKFEKALTNCLYENYPALRFYQRLADTINSVLYENDSKLRIRFKPNFEWSDSGKSVTSIGIRATNSLVSVKKEKRPEVREEYGFIYEKDVKSSVPRVTRSMHLGAWYSDDIDFYEEILKLCEPDGDVKQEREAIKKLYMRAYFDSSLANIGYHTWREMEQSGVCESDVRDSMTLLRQAIEKVSGGKTYGNEIFYIESCVYLGALSCMIMQGYEVWLLYDCFYGRDRKGISPTEKGRNFEKAVNQAVSLGFDFFYNYKADEEYGVDNMLLNTEKLQESIKRKQI